MKEFIVLLLEAVLISLYLWCIGGCQGAGDSPPGSMARRPLIVAPAAGSREESYPAPGHADQAMTVFAPPEGAPSLKRALVVIHGGGWVSGRREEMFAICQSLAKDGFTAATIDYTLASPGSRWPAQLLDCQAAVRYIRSRAQEWGIDPAEIGALGTSAGGHLSLWLGVSDAPMNGISSRVQAVGSISGVLDLTKPMTAAGEQYQIVQKLIADDLKPTLAQKRQASPVFRLNKQSPPVFFVQGKEDPLVPPEQSTDAEARLKALGRPTELVMVNGMGHGLNASEPRQAMALNAMAVWLKAQLKVGS